MSESVIPEHVTDERLRQMAFDPMICNMTGETISVLREAVKLRAKVAEQAAIIERLTARIKYLEHCAQ